MVSDEHGRARSRRGTWARGPLAVAGVAVVGSTLVAASTLVSLSTAPPFMGDEFAQQLAVAQWLHGVAAQGLALGATNYLLHFPLYYVIEGAFGGLSPFVRWAATTLILNISGWLAAYLLSLRLVRSWSSGRSGFWWVSAWYLFFAINSQTIYMLDYPNSRNIELAFVVGLIGMYARLLRGPVSRWWVPLTVLVSTAIFVNDKYAMYVIGGGILAHSLIRGVRFAITSGALRSRHLTVAIAMALSIAAQLITVRLLARFTPIRIIPDPYQAKTFPTAQQIFTNFLKTVDGLMENLGVPVGTAISNHALLVLASGVIILALLLALWSQRRRLSDGFARDLMGMLATIAVVNVALATYSGLTKSRYLVLVSVVASVAGFGLASSPARDVSRGAAGTTKASASGHGILDPSLPGLRWAPGAAAGTILAMAAVLTVPTAAHATDLVSQKAWRPVNADVYAMIDIARHDGIRKIYSSLLQAQSMTYFSRFQVVGIPMYPSTCTPGDPTVFRVHIMDALIEESTLRTVDGPTALYLAPQFRCVATRYTLEDALSQIPLQPKVIDVPGGQLLVYNRDIGSYLK